MVNKRPRRNKRRTVRSIKPVLRRLQAAVSKLPLPARMSADPPVVNQDISYTLTVPINVISSLVESTGFVSYATLGHAAIYRCLVTGSDGAYALNPGEITFEDIKHLVFGHSGMDSIPNSSKFEICVRKILFWGPSRRLTTITAVIDLGPYTPHRALLDSGTATRRPRVGFTIPYDEWIATDTSTTMSIFTFDCDSSTVSYEPQEIYIEGEIVGTIYVSLAVRHTWARRPTWQWPWSKASALADAIKANPGTSSTTTKPSKAKH